MVSRETAVGGIMAGLYIYEGRATDVGSCLFSGSLCPSQNQVLEVLIQTVPKQPFTILTGSAGSGMTTIVPHLNSELQSAGKSYGWINTEFLSREHGADAESIICKIIDKRLWERDETIITNGSDSCFAGKSAIEFISRCLKSYKLGSKSVLLELPYSPSLEEVAERAFPGTAVVRMPETTTADLEYVLTCALGKDNVVNIDFDMLFNARSSSGNSPGLPSIKQVSEIAAAAVAYGHPQPGNDILHALIAKRHKLVGTCKQLEQLHSKLHGLVYAA